MIPALALPLLLVSQVAVHLHAGDDFPVEVQLSAVRAVLSALEAASGHRGLLDDLTWPDCEPSPACADEIARRNQAETTLFVRLLGAASKVRVLATRIRPDGSTQQDKCDLDLQGVGWETQLGPLLTAFFGVRALTERPPAAPDSPRWEIAALVVAGAATIATGMALGIAAQGTQGSVDATFRHTAELVAAEDARGRNALAADILVPSGVAVLVVGAGLWLFDIGR